MKIVWESDFNIKSKNPTSFVGKVSNPNIFKICKLYKNSKLQRWMLWALTSHIKNTREGKHVGT